MGVLVAWCLRRYSTACIVLLFSLEASAQVEPQVAPRATPGCDQFDRWTPAKYTGGTFDPLAPENQSLTSKLIDCMKEMTAAVRGTAGEGQSATPSNTGKGQQVNDPSQNVAAAVDTAPSATLEEKIHLELVKEYLAYRRLRQWNKAYQRSTRMERDTRTDIEAAFEDLSETVEAALTQHGLNQPFSADLVTAFAIQQAGVKPSSTTPSNGTGSSATANPKSPAGGNTQSGAAGLMRWQSIHFYADPDRHWDLDISGQFGFEPVLALVQPAPPSTSSSTTATASPTSAAIASDDVTATFQSAFEWHGAVESNWRFADLSEATVFFRLGQTVLNSTQTVVENGSNSSVAIAAANETEGAELFWEVGASVAIYAQSLEVLHLKKGLLTPMFAFAGGYRHDNRFGQAGVLSAYNHPEQRLFLRFMVDALQLTNKDQADKAFTIGLSVDIGTAFRRSGLVVPSGTRILLRGDLNLFKATQSGSK
jgi:hypothetical protein